MIRASLNLKYHLRIVCLWIMVIVNGFYSESNAQSLIPPSPDAANIGQSLMMPVGFYTGTPSINIPIYTIDAGGFKLPISVSYSGGGIKISSIASWCGLGWNLNAGGLITRSVAGLPDEEPNKGYLVNEIPDSASNQENITYPSNIACYQSEKFCRIAKGELDGEPDNYFFSIPGASGRLVFDTNKAMRTVPMQNVDFQRSAAAGVYYGTCDGCVQAQHGYSASGQATLNWSATDGMGNQYDFADYEKTITRVKNLRSDLILDFSLPSSGGHTYLSDTCITSIGTWHLSAITTRSGQQINFLYDTAVITYSLPVEFSIVSKIGDGTYDPNDYISGTDNTYFVQQVTVKRLSTIEFPNGRIRFITSSTGRADLPGDNALEKIVVENEKGEVIKQFAFDYSYLVGSYYRPSGGFADKRIVPFDSLAVDVDSATNRRLILNSITENDKNGLALNSGTRFEYIFDKGLPDRNSNSCDHWGYANDDDNDGPATVQLSDGTQDYAPGARDPNADYMQQGTLNKITYPTGGYVVYTYQPNAATYPEWTGYQEMYAGGIRVQDVTSVDPLSPDSVIYKTYYYEDGASTAAPYYRYPFYDADHIRLSSGSIYPMGSTQGSFTGYRKVTEKLNDGTDGWTEYYFTNPATNSDLVYKTNPEISSIPELVAHPPVDERDWQRGLLTEQKVYRNDGGFGALKQWTINTYGTVLDTLCKGLRPGYYLNNSYLIPYRLSTGRMVLGRTDVKHFDNEGTEMTSTTKFFYNKRNYLPSQIFRETEYGQEIQYNSYGADFSDLSIPSDYPVETVVMKDVMADPRKIISGTLNEYDTRGNLVRLAQLQIDSGALYRTNFKFAHLPYGTLPFPNDSRGIYAPDTLYHDLANLIWNEDYYSGEVLNEKKLSNSLNEVYIWGYQNLRGRRLVAKIIGSSYDSAIQYVNRSMLDSAIYYSDEQVRTELNKLRTHLPDAFVTSYTYAPLLGITSETDPVGRVTYYEYDGFGRLTRIRDNDSNIIKRICYNYVGQPENCAVYSNAETSGSFVRNNCGQGYWGDTVTYTVPAGKYLSATSQADADSLALNDVNSNGQAYANANGACHQIIYSNQDMWESFTKNDCSQGYTGESVIYYVPSGTYTSTVSQAYADSLAQNDIDTNGQAYANLHGACTQDIMPYVKLNVLNVYTDWYDNTTYGDVVAEFYEDSQGTIPFSVNNLLVYVAINTVFSDNSEYYTDTYLEFNCNDTYTLLISGAILSGYDPEFGKTVDERSFLLPPVGNYYTIW